MKIDINQYWKKDDMEISHSILHYLYAVDTLINSKWYARAVDISKQLNITQWSCSISLKKIFFKWLLKEDENKFITLTLEWQKLVNKNFENRTVLKKYFVNILNLSDDEAMLNACKIEHLVTDNLVKALKTNI